jgi:hypothetical protein
MPGVPSMSTRQPSAHDDAVYLHVVGRGMKRLSRRRVAFVAAAIASAVVVAGFAVGFLSIQIIHG